MPRSSHRPQAMSFIRRAGLALLFLVGLGLAAPVAAQGPKQALLVVPGLTLQRSDAERVRLLKSWGYSVQLIEQTASRTALAHAAADSTVCYLSARCTANLIADKLTEAPIGIVTDHAGLFASLGVANQTSTIVRAVSATIKTDQHPITNKMKIGQPLPDLEGGKITVSVVGKKASGAVVLSEHLGQPHFLVVEKAALLTDNVPAAARRAVLPLDPLRLDKPTRELLRQAVDWAAADIRNTYYVRTRGNDTNSGRSRKDAFRSIARAARVASGGDRVFVGGGVYSGEVRIVRGGARNRTLQFVADISGVETGDKGAVRIRSASVGVEAKARSDVRLRGFRIERSERGIRLQDCRRIELTEIVLFRLAKQAVRADASEWTLRNSTLNRGVDGLQAKKGGALTLISVRVQRSTGTAVTIEDGVQLTARFVDIVGGTHGYKLEAGASATLQKCTTGRCRQHGLTATKAGVVTITDSSFFANQGRGLNSSGDANTQITLDRCRFESNRGKGLYVRAGRLDVTNCLVRDNRNDGLHADEIAAGRLLFVTSAGNRRDGLDCGGSRLTVRNCIAAFNRKNGLQGSRRLDHDYNVVFGNGRDFSGISPGSNSVLSDPAFRDRKAGDYKLSETSPAIDVGQLQTGVKLDLEEEPRQQGPAVDAGCYEAPNGRRLRILKWIEVR